MNNVKRHGCGGVGGLLPCWAGLVLSVGALACVQPGDPDLAQDGAPLSETAQAAIIERLERTFSYPQVIAIVEGVVTAADASVQPTPNADEPTIIATRYTIDVSRSWKSEVPETIATWAYGGFLPDNVSPGYHPRGMTISGEAYLDVGQHVIVAAAESFTLPSSPPKWHTLNGEGGTLVVGLHHDIDSAIQTFLNANFASF